MTNNLWISIHGQDSFDTTVLLLLHEIYHDSNSTAFTLRLRSSHSRLIRKIRHGALSLPYDTSEAHSLIKCAAVEFGVSVLP